MERIANPCDTLIFTVSQHFSYNLYKIDVNNIPAMKIKQTQHSGMFIIIYKNVDESNFVYSKHRKVTD